ncbi:hypothetical protein LTR36_004320 [Oleoguttula mirabilis]|uniref:Uncharacterized protein n=1 Tax=Oleoguttula mirabilis TaxID=1507867 RepID=A0AAV9JHR3_9PEZI|nr:hypothetical protein LTR36_004320 [Oleoguttula mirabilis]
MQPYWPHLKELLEPLTYLVKDGDPDGAELHFTISTNSVQSKKSKELITLVDHHQPMGDTDIEHRLGNLLQMDIVDTEDHQGNVWKMLLGAIDQTFDEEDSDGEGD